jgi:hypothetical protein
MLKTYLSSTVTLSIFVQHIFYQRNICRFIIIFDDGGYDLCTQKYSKD